MEREFTEAGVVSITSTKNRFLADFNLEEIGFRGISIDDSDSLFFKRNYNTLRKYNLFLVDKQYNILSKSEGLTEKFGQSLQKFK